MSARQTARSRGVLLVVLLAGLSAFAPLSIDMYLPALPQITEDLHTGDTQVQITLTGCLVGLGLGQAFAGPLSDTLGRRRPLLISLFLYAAASVLCAFAPSVSVLIVLRILQGLAGAVGIVLARAIIRDLRTGRAMARLFAVVLTVNGLAPILAPVIGAQLLRVTSWRVLFVVLAVLGALLLAGVAAWLPESLPPQRRRPGSIAQTLHTFGRLALDRRFVGYLLTFGFSFGTMFAYISASPFVLQEVRHLSAQQFSLIFACNGVGLVAFSQLSGRLVGRIEPRALLRGGALAQACGSVGVLIVATGAPLWALLVSLFVAVAPLGLVMPNVTALALADYGGEAGTASAAMGTFQFLIGAVVPPLLGLSGLSQGTAMGVIMVSLAAVSLLGCFAVAETPWRPSRPSADASG